MCIALRNKFIQIIHKNLSEKDAEKKNRLKKIKKILDDIEQIGLFDELDYEYNHFEDIEILADMVFCEKEEKRDEQILNVASISVERIRKKQVELGIKPSTDEEILAAEISDFSRYGRSPLHEAIAMREIDLISQYVKEKKYLLIRDNNGNTPQQMAIQENYREAIEIFEEFC